MFLQHAALLLYSTVGESPPLQQSQLTLQKVEPGEFDFEVRTSTPLNSWSGFCGQIPLLEYALRSISIAIG